MPLKLGNKQVKYLVLSFFWGLDCPLFFFFALNFPGPRCLESREFDIYFEARYFALLCCFNFLLGVCLAWLKYCLHFDHRVSWIGKLSQAKQNSFKVQPAENDTVVCEPKMVLLVGRRMPWQQDLPILNVLMSKAMAWHATIIYIIVVSEAY